jgi:hypothetical protein
MHVHTLTVLMSREINSMAVYALHKTAEEAQQTMDKVNSSLMMGGSKLIASLAREQTALLRTKTLRL